MKIKRNAPCSCGSGRKHKQCCGKVAAVSDFARERNLRIEMTIGKKALDWATLEYGLRTIEEAWFEFGLDILGIPIHDLDERVPFSAWFYPWWLYGGSVAHDDSPPPIEEYLDSCRTPEDSFERRMIEVIEDTPFSIHRVVDVDAGRSLTLEDVFTGQCQIVQERTGSVDQAHSTYMFARVAIVDGIPGLYGNGPLLIEPTWFLNIKALRDGIEEQLGRNIAEEDLFEYDVEIRDLYLNYVVQTLDPAPPQLVNYDGETVAPSRLIYELECDCEHAFDKLKTMAKGHKPAELLDEAEHDAEGRLVKITLPWIDSLKPNRTGMGSTILGELHIEPGRLEIVVNSTERADKIRKRISRRLGTAAKFKHAAMESMESMEEMLAERGEEGPELDQDAPEIQEAIAQMMKQRWAAWFDESIPMLEGLTPREAAKTEEGRELLEVLLAFYDRQNQKLPGNPAYANTAEMRRELGIE